MILSQKFSTKRKPPKNFTARSLDIFEHELFKSFDQSFFYHIEDGFIDSQGIIVVDYKISHHSLRHLRRKVAFTFFDKLRIVMKRLLSRKAIRRLPEALWITDSWSKGYFHWFGDVLPILLVLKEKQIHSELIIPAEYLNLEYVVESLKALGVKYTGIDRDEVFQVDNLTVSELIAPAGNYKPESMRKLRSSILSYYKLTTKPQRKVYISRGDKGRRILTNEDALKNLLTSFDFEIVQMENLSFISQVQLMSETALLIGAHGAGLTNMIFMPANSKIIELRAEGDKSNNCYFNLAGALDIDYYYSFCERISTKNDHIGDLIANTNHLRALLE